MTFTILEMRSFSLGLAGLAAMTGCAGSIGSLAGVKPAGYDPIEMTIGVLPVPAGPNDAHSVSEFIAREMDSRHFFRAVKAASTSPEDRFDLLLIWPQLTMGFGEFKVLSGYTNKVLYQDKVFAPGGLGIGKGIKLIAKAFAAGRPANQELMAEREVYRRNLNLARAGASMAAAPSKTYSSPVDEPGYRLPSDPRRFAVVVGIERYPALPPAEFAERDAQAVRRHLLSLGYPERNVILLTGSQASRAGLVKNIETWLANNVNEQSTVFFYYSGHGAPDPETGEAYLVPADGDPEYLKDTAYPLKRLYAKLGELKAKEVLVALDSCFSGAGGRSVLAKGTRPLVTQVDWGGLGPGLVAFTASDSRQISGSDEEQGHGLFTYHFLAGLNGAAADAGGRVTVKSLYEYVTPRVQDSARRRNRRQTPQLLPPGGGGMESLKLR